MITAKHFMTYCKILLFVSAYNYASSKKVVKVAGIVSLYKIESRETITTSGKQTTPRNEIITQKTENINEQPH